MKKYLIKYSIITTLILIINLYFYLDAEQCPLPKEGFQTLCGSGFTLIFILSLLFLIPYTIITVIRLLKDRSKKINL